MSRIPYKSSGGSSTAITHATYLDRLLDWKVFLELSSPSMDSENDEFKSNVKPIFMTVDGGPDETPRYEKVINNAIKHFDD